MSKDTPTFDQFDLPSKILENLQQLGYEQPTPVQEASIPLLIAKEDVVAQAQTGTGKTAAFTLPILSQIDIQNKKPQALIIAPTRELAIQVAEACQSYSKGMKGFVATAIYGGQDYQIQLRALKRGSQVIVGTPGRLMDHIDRGTLDISGIQTVVLDEADEMLKMGFIDDIEWILERTPESRQTALFSATMPKTIQNIATDYLNNPQHVHIQPKQRTLSTIAQVCVEVRREQKMAALTRFLEMEQLSAAIIFVRTKTISGEIAEKLQARGYAAAALNGDMSQSLREKVIGRIKSGSLDIIVATDVAARGIDVERISHVINYDIPYDVESYIHRIGRTGRAGRSGKAILFVSPREYRLLRDIERHTKQPIEKIQPPTLAEMNQKRLEEVRDKIVNIIAKSKKLGPYQTLVQQMMATDNLKADDIAAAMCYLMMQNNPLGDQDIDFSPSKKRHDKSRSSGASRKKSFGKKPPFKERSNRRVDGNDKKPRWDKAKRDQKSYSKKPYDKASSEGYTKKRKKPASAQKESTMFGRIDADRLIKKKKTKKRFAED